MIKTQIQVKLKYRWLYLKFVNRVGESSQAKERKSASVADQTYQGKPQANQASHINKHHFQDYIQKLFHLLG